MSAHLAAYSAIGLSVLSMLVCVVTVPKLTSMINDINEQVVVDMDEFKAIENRIYASYRQKASEFCYISEHFCDESLCVDPCCRNALFLIARSSSGVSFLSVTTWTAGHLGRDILGDGNASKIFSLFNTKN